jgi:EAL domain-containing protein (putative c-di-GMP-specific phosphodiesterase class I)
LTVLAEEGVENEAQLDFLIAERCHSAQGFFLSQPIEENLLTNHLVARQGRMRDTDKFRLGISA